VPVLREVRRTPPSGASGDLTADPLNLVGIVAGTSRAAAGTVSPTATACRWRR
jgi:hypothetical protein